MRPVSPCGLRPPDLRAACESVRPAPHGSSRRDPAERRAVIIGKAGGRTGGGCAAAGEEGARPQGRRVRGRSGGGAIAPSSRRTSWAWTRPPERARRRSAGAAPGYSGWRFPPRALPPRAHPTALRSGEIRAGPPGRRRVRTFVAAWVEGGGIGRRIRAMRLR